MRTPKGLYAFRSEMQMNVFMTEICLKGVAVALCSPGLKDLLLHRAALCMDVEESGEHQ